MKIPFSPFTALIALTLCLASCGENTTSSDKVTEETDSHANHDIASEKAQPNKMMDLMHENMETMKKVERNGNFDHDFAELMAAHHEGAIKMAQEEVDKGSDTMLVNMARKSIPKQEEEQKKLRQHAKKHESGTKNAEATASLMQPRQSMMGKMDHNMKGTTDHHFAHLMSMHHQSGIEMVNAYLPNAKATEVKAMAEKTKVDQQKGKQKLEMWLQQNKP